MWAQAVVTLFIFLVAVFLPVVKTYHGYMLPLTLVLSYLWLTSLIFAALDYSGGRCRPYHCRLKHTVEAFQIIGLCVSSTGMLRAWTDGLAVCFCSLTRSSRRWCGEATVRTVPRAGTLRRRPPSSLNRRGPQRRRRRRSPRHDELGGGRESETREKSSETQGEDGEKGSNTQNSRDGAGYPRCNGRLGAAGLPAVWCFISRFLLYVL